MCVSVWGGAVSMVTTSCHPQWVLKDKASHTHIHTHLHTALQGQLSQINISPHLKNRIQNGFPALRLQPCFRPWVFALKTQSAKW